MTKEKEGGGPSSVFDFFCVQTVEKPNSQTKFSKAGCAESQGPGMQLTLISPKHVL